MQRFTFRFVNTAQHRTEEVVIIGHYYEEAKAGSWYALADKEQDRYVRDSWRMVSIDQRPAGMLKTALVGACLMVAAFLPGLASADDFDTVGAFRTWHEDQQTTYVMAFGQFSTLLGMRCEVSRSVGEVAAAIRWSSRLKPEDNLARSLFAVMMQDGCSIPKEKQ